MENDHWIKYQHEILKKLGIALPEFDLKRPSCVFGNLPSDMDNIPLISVADLTHDRPRLVDSRRYASRRLVSILEKKIEIGGNGDQWNYVSETVLKNGDHFELCYGRDIIQFGSDYRMVSDLSVEVIDQYENIHVDMCTGLGQDLVCPILFVWNKLMKNREDEIIAQIYLDDKVDLKGFEERIRGLTPEEYIDQISRLFIQLYNGFNNRNPPVLKQDF